MNHNSTAPIMPEEVKDTGPSKAEAQKKGLKVDEKGHLGKRELHDSMVYESEISDNVHHKL